MSQAITRFAPSPTGALHLGHVYAAWVAARNGAMRLRIDDLDALRCRPEYERAIYADLRWLGISWHGQVWRQSQRVGIYERALNSLRERALVYPCWLSRRERDEVLRAPHVGRAAALAEFKQRAHAKGRTPVWRLRMDLAIEQAGALSWRDEVVGLHSAAPKDFGDVVLARRDIPASYHLATVIDDAQSEVSLVTRAQDLLPFCHLHRLLQALLDLPEPRWLHHELLLNHSGQRLSKRTGAQSVSELREQGMRPDEVIKLACARAARSVP